ncbi:hypothetical protein [Mycolicibacterium stellerae]|uniref:hypothetical protein n=1 Tax=Mycolicibacterium stellerae TaxID=2358193 RepID=UPI0013DE2F34|nr:hypothetical protein [Mycolicibacterium stellerae]
MLPADLVDETRRTLDQVERLNLPAPVWPRINESLRRIDVAAGSGDVPRLGAELVALRIVAGVGPPARPDWATGPAPLGPPQPDAIGGYGYGRPVVTGRSGSRRRPWIWVTVAIAGAIAVFLLALVVSMSDSNVSGPGSSTSRTASQSPIGPTTSPHTTPAYPSESSKAGVVVAIIIAAVLVVVGVAVLLIIGQNRSARHRSTGVAQPPSPPPQAPVLSTLPMPAEMREQLNRTVHTVLSHGGRG